MRKRSVRYGAFLLAHRQASAPAFGRPFFKRFRGNSVRDRKDIKLLHGPKSDSVQHMTIHVNQIRMHHTFADLLRIDPDMREKITQSMCVHGFFESQPVVFAVWPGQEEPILADGNTRIQAARNAGITRVPFVISRFENEMDALQHVTALQTARRATTDSALYRLCAQFDRLMEPGRHRKNGEPGELTTRVVHFVGPSAWAKKTAQLIGCNYRKVDRIRKIRRDGWPEIQEAVRNDEMTINKAYKLIRDVELGNDDNGKKQAAAHIKTLKTLLTEQNFAVLEELGGDVGDHVNKALEVYVRWLHNHQNDLPAEQEADARQNRLNIGESNES